MFSVVPWRRQRSSSALAQVDPFRLINEEFDNMFGRMFGPSPLAQLSDWWNNARSGWGLTVEDKDNEVVVRAELPGFDVKDIDVQLTQNVLTIEAREGKDKAEESGDRPFRHVRRALTLPAGLDSDKVEASYKNGVLEIHVPRTPQAQPRKIEIKS